ncbi:hypothetical protein [Halonotius terrestris]|uniref:hypothetical protein n=1 Tax=Halonotius terrestris TaxID=2487750 RepID=UPI00163D2775|nr:hypothetical protein [Halonotius terrestris]
MDSYPAAYSPTGYGIHDGEAVVRTPHTVKTLQGDGVDVICELLAVMDGTTAASELIDRIPEGDAEFIDLLYEAGLAYDARAIPAELKTEGWEGLLEPALATMAHASHRDVPERLAACTVAVFGDREPVSGVCSRLQAAGVSVGDGTADDPDVILLSEQLERSESWTDANEQWAASSATLVKTRLTETGWRLGPVLTADARACLNCVYSRVDANKAGGQLFTDVVTGDPPYMAAYTDTVTEILFRALLGVVPRYLDEQFAVYDHYEGRIDTPRVFASPHCEVCDDA